MDKTPDPAVREMILRMEQIGCDTTFDRFDKQKPQCTFGIPDDTDDVKALAGKLADVLLADLSRPTPDDYEAIKALASAERQKV